MTRQAPIRSIDKRRGVLKLVTARGKGYGSIIGLVDGSARLARQKFSTATEAADYRARLQPRYETFELDWQLAQLLGSRPWWRRALDWLLVKLGREPRLPDLVAEVGFHKWRRPQGLDIAERQRLVRQINAKRRAAKKERRLMDRALRTIDDLRKRA